MKPKLETRREAAESGRLKYLSTSSCRRCDGRLRYTRTGACVACSQGDSKRLHREIKELLEAALDNGEA